MFILPRKSIVIFIIAALLMLFLALVSAGDENASNGDPDDNNACYAGGDWSDGRCVDDWWWNAGWYRQAVIENRIPVEKVPDQYKSGVTDLQPNLPPIPTPEVTPDP